MSNTAFIEGLRQRLATGAQQLGSGLGNSLGSRLGLSRPVAPERSRELIRNANRWDRRTWKQVRATDAVEDLVLDLALGDDHKGGTRPEFAHASELAEALFYMLYKANPALEDRRRLDRELYPLLKIAEEMQGHPALRELHEFTANDGVTSTVAMEAMAPYLREIIGRLPPPPPPPQPKPKKKQEKQEQDKQEKQDGEEQPQEGEPGEGEPGEEGEPGQPGQPGQPGEPGEDEGDQEGQPGSEGSEPDDSEKGEGDGESGDGNADDEFTEEDGEDFDPFSEEAMEQAEAEWEALYDEQLKDLDLDRLAHKMLGAAQEEAEELDKIRKGVGLEDGEWQSTDPEKRIEYANRFRTPEMKALSEILGQMKRFALGVKATRVNDVPHEPYDVETGNNLHRALKSQFALLGHPQTTYEFYRRYSAGELLQFKMRGTEEVGKGPIVVCIDKSGSMDGKPFMWAMAVAEALRRFAADEDRDYFAMYFGFNEDRHRFDFPGGKGDFEKVLTFLSAVANGGTAFDGVLTEALERASTQFDTEGKAKADIVFITDGVASLSEQWIAGFNAERARIGVRLFSVYIGGAADMSGKTGPVGLLNQISDVVIPVKDLKPSAARQIFAHV